MKQYCRYYLLFGLLLMTGFYGVSQTPDVFRLEYMLMPENKSEVQLSRIKLVANVPITLKSDNTIIIGSEYNRIAYELKRDVAVDTAGLSLFHILDVNFAYVYKYNEDWKFIGVVTPRLASTFTNPLENGDFGINITVGAFRDRQNIEKPTRLVIGLAYNSSVVYRIPLPFVYYEKRFHPKWTYVLGAPKTGLKFHPSGKHTLQSEFILDGYFVNLQNNVLVSDTGLASSISSSAALVTFGYQYNLTKEMAVYAFAGHTLFNNGVLRDNDRNDIFTLNDQSSFYFRTGFRIGI